MKAAQLVRSCLVATAVLSLSATAPRTGSSSAEAGPVLLAAGDIADCRDTGDESTAAVVAGIPGATVATLGDHAYPDGTVEQFTSCYQPSWGQFASRTRPSPGNHDYRTADASAYFDYFGASAGERGKGYYSYDLGDWHVVVLNSNCRAVGCGAGSAQEQWLRADLAANPRDCTLAYWHHARFTSGPHGPTTKVGPFWQALYEAGADVVLSAHDHHYERFAPQDPAGRADLQGLTEFVVGTGGSGLRALTQVQPNSAVRETSSIGVLRLTLGASSFSWQFLAVSGSSFTDSGWADCVNRPTTPTTR